MQYSANEAQLMSVVKRQIASLWAFGAVSQYKAFEYYSLGTDAV
jgi:hypothetical protein